MTTLIISIGVFMPVLVVSLGIFSVLHNIRNQEYPQPEWKDERDWEVYIDSPMEKHSNELQYQEV